jgi:hypothetical protein
MISFASARAVLVLNVEKALRKWGRLTPVMEAKTRPIWHYFIGEKSVGRMYVTSTLFTSLSACSDFIIS